MPIGSIAPDFIANTFRADAQFNPKITGLADGRFVAIWESSDTGDGSRSCIRARIFNADGSGVGDDFIVNSTTAFAQTLPDIEALPNGGFIAVIDSYAADGIRPIALARIYSPDGSPVGGDFEVNEQIRSANLPTVASRAADGRIAVVWEGGGVSSGSIGDIKLRFLNADGTSAAEAPVEFFVNTTITLYQVDPAVTFLTDGRCLIAWESGDNGDGSGTCIRAIILNADGSRSAGDFVVNSTAQDDQVDPTVTALPNGRFLIAWQSRDTGDGNGGCIRARFYEADGTPAGPDFIVNSVTRASPSQVEAAGLPDGRVMLTWSHIGDVQARLFNANGTPDGDEFIYNSTTTSTQSRPDIALLRDGRMALAWESFDIPAESDNIRVTIIDPRTGASNWTGTEAAEQYAATALNDSLAGLGGNDTLYGAVGADTMDGGTGSDTLGYAASPEAVTVNLATSSVSGGHATGDVISGFENAIGTALADTLTGSTAANRLSGNAGSDVLVGDGPLSLSPEAQSIRRLYIATLDRAPDDGGWIGWATQREGGTSLDQIAAGFVNSKEFQTKYGELDNTQFVTRLYNNVLDRNPDAGGLAAYVDALTTGALTRTQVVTTFSESREFADGTSNTINAGQVYRLCGATLGRAPDGGGFETWTDALGSGRALVDIAAGFVNSEEFQRLYGPLNNDDFVTLLYQNVLGRGPDTGGLAFWTGQLGSGAQTRTQVVTGFSESLEYINGTRPGVDAFMRNVMTAWSDTLIGGAGDDKMTGGRGADRYVFLRSEAGNDTVYGFDSFDTLELRGFGFANSTQALAAMSQQGSDVQFNFGDGSVRFVSTQLSTLQSLPAEGWVFG